MIYVLIGVLVVGVSIWIADWEIRQLSKKLKDKNNLRVLVILENVILSPLLLEGFFFLIGICLVLKGFDVI